MLNENIIGKKYSADVYPIIDTETMFYALACNDDNRAYFDIRRPGGIIAPPMFAVRYAGSAALPMLFDETVGIDIGQMLHYSQEFEWRQPVHPGDRIRSENEITHITFTAYGAILGSRVSSFNQRDELVTVSRWEFFDRSSGKKDAGKPRISRDHPGEIIFSQEIRIRDDQTFIYAAASGDRNQIHTDEAMARSAGLPGIIVHGLCTMAFTHHAIVDNLTGPERDPMRMTALRVEFGRPVFPGQTLTVQGFHQEAIDSRTRYGIIAKNDLKKNIFSGSWCEIVR